jgi:hypothetical protein
VKIVHHDIVLYEHGSFTGYLNVCLLQDYFLEKGLEQLSDICIWPIKLEGPVSLCSCLAGLNPA